MTDRADELISRVVDGDVGDVTWRRLVTKAEAEPELWRDLAFTQREHAVLGHAVASAAAVADGVEVPLPQPRRLMGPWTGWAVAAVLALAWLTGSFPSRPQPTNQMPVNTAGWQIPRASTAEDAFQQYLELGRDEQSVVQEIPTRVLLKSRPLMDGDGYELVYIRQVVERSVVSELVGLQFATTPETPEPRRVRPGSM